MSEIDFIDTFATWYDTRLRNGQPLRLDPHSMRCDMAHSSLLRRLLQGKPLLPEPPPKAHSYPNYELMDKGFWNPYEIHAPTNDCGAYLIIDQARWDIIAHLDERDWIVSYQIVDSAALVTQMRQAGHIDLQTYLTAISCVDLPRRRAATKFRVHRTGVAQGRDQFELAVLPAGAKP